MISTVQIPSGQRLNIVIDDIIFLRKEANASLEQWSGAPSIVIDDIIFMKMQEWHTVSFDPADIEKLETGTRIKVEAPPFRRSGSPEKRIIIDPNECFVEMNENAIVTYRWMDDNGIKRKLFEQYKLEDLDYLTVVRDGTSGRLVFNLYRL